MYINDYGKVCITPSLNHFKWSCCVANEFLKVQIFHDMPNSHENNVTMQKIFTVLDFWNEIWPGHVLHTGADLLKSIFFLQLNSLSHLPYSDQIRHFDSQLVGREACFQVLSCFHVFRFCFGERTWRTLLKFLKYKQLEKDEELSWGPAARGSLFGGNSKSNCTGW